MGEPISLVDVVKRGGSLYLVALGGQADGAKINTRKGKSDEQGTEG